MLGCVGAGVGMLISGASSGFLTKTYTNVFSSFCGWSGITGAVGAGALGAWKTRSVGYYRQGATRSRTSNYNQSIGEIIQMICSEVWEKEIKVNKDISGQNLGNVRPFDSSTTFSCKHACVLEVDFNSKPRINSECSTSTYIHSRRGQTET